MPLKYLPLPLIACLLTFAFGGLFIPGAWYESLNRAPWSPPNIAFPIVWFVLYIFIALSGWQIFSSNKNPLKKLWSAQLLINAIWSWVFFGKHWVALGFVNISLLAALLVYLIMLCHQHSLKLSVSLLLPYLSWLLLALSLNGYILIYN